MREVTAGTNQRAKVVAQDDSTLGHQTAHNMVWAPIRANMSGSQWKSTNCIPR